MVKESKKNHIWWKEQYQVKLPLNDIHDMEKITEPFYEQYRDLLDYPTIFTKETQPIANKIKKIHKELNHQYFSNFGFNGQEDDPTEEDYYNLAQDGILQLNSYDCSHMLREDNLITEQQFDTFVEMAQQLEIQYKLKGKIALELNFDDNKKELCTTLYLINNHNAKELKHIKEQRFQEFQIKDKLPLGKSTSFFII